MCKSNGKDKVILDEIKFLKDYRFPIKLDDKSYQTVMSSWLLDFNTNVNNLSFLTTKEKNNIIVFANSLLKSFDLYFDDIAESYNYFCDAINIISENLPCINLGFNNTSNNIRDNYYRILAKSNKEFSYKEMLHIPFDKRYLISDYRFSTAGTPCTYMSNDCSIAWAETNMPNDFQIAEYTVCDNNKLMLRLDINPISVYGEIKGNPNKMELSLKFLYLFPLVAFCSVVCDDSSKRFKEEYVIPQMLMYWLKKEKKYFGIRYRSDKKYDLIRNNCGYNIAILATDEDDDHYCKKLKRVFGVNEKMQSVNFKEKFEEKHIKTLNEIKKFYKDVFYEYQHNLFPKSYPEILRVCKGIIINCDLLLSSNGEKETNAALENLNNVVSSAKKVDNEYSEENKKMPGYNDREKETKRIIDKYNTEILPKITDFSNVNYKLLCCNIKFSED